MSGELLSQDEIDALLRGTANEDEQATTFNVDDYLTELEKDALGEIGNISFGSSATALSTLLAQKVDITTPTVSIIEKKNINDEFQHPYVAIQVEYTEGFSGKNLLVIKQSDAAIIADLMLGGNGQNPNQYMDEIHLSAVQEAMNQMMGSAATSMSTIFNKRVDISPPAVDLIDLTTGEGKNNIPEQDLFVKISFRLMIGTLVDSTIMQLLPIEFAKSLVAELLSTNNMDSNGNSNQPDQQPIQQELVSNKESDSNKEPVSEESRRGGQSPAEASNNSSEKQQNLSVQPAVFANFDQTPAVQPETKNLNMLLDIPLQVTVELGRTSRSIKDILELGAGSIIELDKLAGEPVDILVNNQLIAFGEVVVIDENFGVRITDIVSQRDRIKKLR